MATKELKELVGFGLSVGELVAALLDGIGVDDAEEALEVAMRAVPGITGADLALAEYVAMSDEEAAELEAFVIADFDIPADNVEAAVEGALKVAIMLRGLINIFKKPL